MDQTKDYYATLGVLPTTEDAVIRAAYKALALRYHPDRFVGKAYAGNRSMSEINEAYAVLSDSEQRKAYDNLRDSGSSDSWFSDDADDLPPAHDPLEHDWAIAVKIYPDLRELEALLTRITWRLAYSYRAYLLDSKLFDDRRRIAENMRTKFFELHFGSNPKLVEFACALIDSGQRRAALALHAASHVLGNKVDAVQLINQINNTFSLPRAATGAELANQNHHATAGAGLAARSAAIKAGVIGGLTGGVSIWIYEALVWVGVQHQMPLAGIPRNATGLVFGAGVQESLGLLAHVVGTGIHFFFAIAWGVLFAQLWPWFRSRGFEATFVALFYAVVAWIVMHAAIMLVSDNHPNYYDPAVIIGGFMSHLFFTVPLALIVKRRLAA